MGVENNNNKSENNDKYTLLKELNTSMVYDVKELNSEEKDFKLYSALLDFFQYIEIFEQANYKRGETRKQVSDIYQNLLKTINLEKLESFSIKKGILVLNYENGKQEYKNLIFSEEKGQEYITELKNTGKIIIDSLNKLDNGLNNERILGGAIVISYGVSSRVGNHFLDKVVIKLSNGLTQILNLTEGGINFGTKEEIKSNLFKILEKEGILYEPEKSVFYRIEDTKISLNLREEVSKITYEQYKELCESNGEKFSEKVDFELNKQKVLVELNKTELTISNIKEAQALVGKYGFGSAIQHAIFFPVFFKVYHSQTADLASLGKSLSEWGLFELGASSGLKIAKNIPIKNPILMAGTATILSLGLGVGSILAGEKIGEKIKLDKKFWKAYPEREDYWEKKGWGGKSFLTHAITLGTVNDLVDKGGFDIKIPFIPISFIETNVNFDTDIMGYMSSAVGRDQDFWNKKVGEYSDNITKDIVLLLDKYKKNEYLPNMDEYYGIEQDKIKKSPEQKLSELKNSLISLLKIGTGKNENIKNEILTGILGLIKSGNFNVNMETINFIISNNLSKLKLDYYSKEKRKNELALQDFKIKTFLGLNENLTDNLVLQKRVFELENPIKGLNEEEIIFCRKIYERIINHERMIELNDDLGKKSKEKILYNKLIENDGFVQFLNLVVEHKRDKDFLTNINKTGYAVDWKLI